MASLPTRLADIRNLFEAFEWDRLSSRVESEAHARLAIVGPVNSGKSTLFNRIKGRKVSSVKAVPGTTRGLVTESFGPCTLVDTPGFGEVGGVDRAAIAKAAVEEADVAVLVLDAAAGLHQSDYELYEALRAARVPLVVALNKIDLIKRDLRPVLEDVERKLGRTVIPISAKTGAGVGEKLLPAIVEAHPWMATALGRALPAYRRQLSRKIIRNAALFNGVIAAVPIPLLDIPVLMTSQVQLVLRIAAVYGESLSVHHARELLTAMAGSVVLRYLATELGTFVPVVGWLASGIVTGLGTWGIGRVAVAYFEAGRRIPAEQLRKLYKRLVRHPRKSAEEEIGEGVSDQPTEQA
jgi:small GTP-binding protein